MRCNTAQRASTHRPIQPPSPRRRKAIGEGDAFCRKERFDDYQRALGDRITLRTLPDSAANPAAVMSNPHSVVTAHLIDKAGEPTRAAVDEILAFFSAKLKQPRSA